MSDVIEKEKYDHSIEVLKFGAEMSEEYYGKPLLLAYSGGKDSDALLQLALESGIKFEVQNSHTTVDAPDTVYHIREVFKKLNDMGIPTYILHARRKDGSLITMWNLIEEKKYPPTRLARYCCLYLKEQTTPNRLIALGVREEESVRRRGRNDFSTWTNNRNERVYRDLKQAKQGKEIADGLMEDNPNICVFIRSAMENKDLICNPIYKWTEEDVWNFLRDRGVKTNPLYEKGFKRVGCIGCPLASTGDRKRGFALYPQYKYNYIKAFDRMDKSRYKEGSLLYGKSGKELFDWWVEDPRFFGQEELDGWREDE